MKARTTARKNETTSKPADGSTPARTSSLQPPDYGLGFVDDAAGGVLDGRCHPPPGSPWSASSLEAPAFDAPVPTRVAGGGLPKGRLAEARAHEVRLAPEALGHPAEALIRAHEQVHVQQFRAWERGAPAAPAAALEREADRGARALLAPRPFVARLGAEPEQTLGFGGAGVQFGAWGQSDPQAHDPTIVTIPDEEIIEPGATDLILFSTATAVVILPARPSAVYLRESGRTPNEPLASVATIGHGGFRAVNLGTVRTKTAFALDAGIPMALYPHAAVQVQRALGVESFLGLLVLHLHHDHTRRVHDFVTSQGIEPANVHYPAAFEVNPNAPSSTFAGQMARLRARFGPGTVFSPIPTPTEGLYFHDRIVEGHVRFDYYGLTEAFQKLERDRRDGTESKVADRASLLVRATHVPTGTSILFLGDLRGDDLAAFREAMGPESFEQVLHGVTTVSGFQHHMATLRARDRAGLAAFLDQIFEVNGQLSLVVQSTESRAGQQFLNRPLIEALRRAGVDVYIAGAPVGAVGTVTMGTKGTVWSSGQGVEAFFHETSMDTPLRRLERLQEAAPIATEYAEFLVAGADRAKQLETARRALEGNLREYRRLLLEGVGDTAEGRAKAGPTNEAALKAAMRAIEIEAPIEDVLRLDGMRVLRQLAEIGPHLRVLRDELRRARAGRGTLSTAGIEALWSVDPRLAERILTSSSLPRAEQRRIMQQLPGAPPRVRARVGAGLLLAISILNELGPLVRQVKLRAREEDVGVAMTDIGFWQDVGMRVRVEGVRDGFGTDNERTTSISRVNQLSSAKDLDYLAMTDVIKEGDEVFGPWQVFEVWCQGHVRNLRDWRELIDRNPSLSSTGTAVDARTWSYRRGRIDEGVLGFGVTTWYEPDADLSAALNRVATRMVRTTASEIERIETKPGPHRGQDVIGPVGYSSTPIYERAPRAVGLRRFRPELEETELYTLANQASREVPADLLLYVFARDFRPAGADPTPDGYVVVGGADYSSYARLTRREYNLIHEHVLDPWGRSTTVLGRASAPLFFARETDLVEATRR